ncbi:hypothetical protein DMP23_40770 [Amycolatopsis sp. A1MSW2902]
MSRLSVRILPARRRNHALSLAPAAVSNLDFAVRSGQSGPWYPLAALSCKPPTVGAADDDRLGRVTVLASDA